MRKKRKTRSTPAGCPEYSLSLFRFSTEILGSDHVNDDVLRRRFARARLQTKRVFQANCTGAGPLS